MQPTTIAAILGQADEDLDAVRSYAGDTNEAAAHCAGDGAVIATQADFRARGWLAQAEAQFRNITLCMDRVEPEGLPSSFVAAMRAEAKLSAERIREAMTQTEQLSFVAYAMADLDNARINAQEFYSQATRASEDGEPGNEYAMWHVAAQAIDRMAKRLLHHSVTDQEAIALSELAVETLADATEIAFDYRWSAPES